MRVHVIEIVTDKCTYSTVCTKGLKAARALAVVKLLERLHYEGNEWAYEMVDKFRALKSDKKRVEVINENAKWCVFFTKIETDSTKTYDWVLS